MSSFLQFPNARLQIHNLLADERISGAEAIARCAKRYGVISELDGAKLEELQKARDNCDCCEAAHQVLKLHFQSKESEFSSDTLEKAYRSMLIRLCKYRYKNDCNQEKSEPHCRATCSSLAPVIFDLMLQEVRRYS